MEIRPEREVDRVNIILDVTVFTCLTLLSIMLIGLIITMIKG